MENLDQSLSNKNILDESMSNISGRLSNYSSKISSLKSEISSVNNSIDLIKYKISKINELTDSLNTSYSDLSIAEANLAQAKAMGALSNISLIRGNINAINSKISSLKSELSSMETKVSLENNLARKYELLDQKKQELNAMLIGDKGVKPNALQDVKNLVEPINSLPKDIKQVIVESEPKALGIGKDTDLLNVANTKKTSKDFFAFKSVAIVLVVLGLTFGILKYKKII